MSVDVSAQRLGKLVAIVGHLVLNFATAATSVDTAGMLEGSDDFESRLCLQLAAEACLSSSNADVVDDLYS